jgi:hypothetical protein
LNHEKSGKWMGKIHWIWPMFCGVFTTHIMPSIKLLGV